MGLDDNGLIAKQSACVMGGDGNCYYEGNLYDAVNLRLFHERLMCAAGRLVQKYPTVARTHLEDHQYIPVGWMEYGPEQGIQKVDITYRSVLDQWCPTAREEMQSALGDKYSEVEDEGKTYTFQGRELARILAHLIMAKDEDANPTLSQQTEPYDGKSWHPDIKPKAGLWIVGDSGVYVMANCPGLTMPGGSGAVVSYAHECNPHKMAFDDWREAKRVGFGADDGVEFIDLPDQIKKAREEFASANAPTGTRLGPETMERLEQVKLVVKMVPGEYDPEWVDGTMEVTWR